MMLPVLSLLALLGSLPIASALTTVSLPLDLEQPSNARSLSKDVVGVSIELPSFPDFAGSAVGQPNEFVRQALENLKNLTGVAVPVRVGGTPEDSTFLRPSAEIGLYNATYPAATTSLPYPAASRVLVSSDFYKLSGNFPAGTEFTWGLNLGSLNISETVAQAQAIYDAFEGADVSLALMEIGNEADLFGRSFTARGPRIPGFDMEQYVTFQVEAIGNISQVLNLDQSGGPSFMVGSFTNPFLWTIGDLLGTSILTSASGKYVSTFSAHHYMSRATGSNLTDPPPGWLLSKEAIRNNCTRAQEDANQAEEADLDFIMGETNSASNHGIYGSSNTAEAAIWQVAYVLQQATFGVKRLFFHNGNGYAYNMMQPVALDNGPAATPQPVLQGIYYGTYMLNDFIGSSRAPYIAELTTNSTDISAYGLFDNGTLVRAMLVNYDTYFGSSANRSSETVELAGLEAGRQISIKRFYTPYTNSTSGMNWGGVTFDAETAEPVGSVYTTQSFDPRLAVNASEVVMVSFA